MIIIEQNELDHQANNYYRPFKQLLAKNNLLNMFFNRISQYIRKKSRIIPYVITEYSVRNIQHWKCGTNSTHTAIEYVIKVCLYIIDIYPTQYIYTTYTAYILFNNIYIYKIYGTVCIDFYGILVYTICPNHWPTFPVLTATDISLKREKNVK